jgi:5'-3' exoribonuclease 2
LQLRKNISKSYIEALKWICLYYYKGVASWSWYYPFHYSPFFTDIVVEEPEPFDKGSPFKPF